MNPRVKTVAPLNNYQLRLLFENGEEGLFNVKPFLDYPAFECLQDAQFFKQAKVAMGFVTWNGETDIDPDTLYLESKKK